MGNGNADAGCSYTPAKTAYPQSETHKRRGEESGFPCTDSFFICCCCYLLLPTPRFHAARPERPV